MKAIVATVSFAAFFALATSVKAQFTPPLCDVGFDLKECVTNATHILVVTPQGGVTEVWKGDARRGDTIPVHALANLTLTQSRHREIEGLGRSTTTHVSFTVWPSA